VHLVCDGKSFKADNYAKATAALEDTKKAPAGSAEQAGVSGRKGYARVPFERGGSSRSCVTFADVASDDRVYALFCRPAVRGGGGGKGDEANDVYKLVRMCKDKKFFPVIVFSFSRRETEANCSMCSKLAFNNEEEAAQVQAVCAFPF
jgi:ATP-dependent RNA helicase DOB1